jgi:hypothetical protein
MTYCNWFCLLRSYPDIVQRLNVLLMFEIKDVAQAERIGHAIDIEYNGDIVTVTTALQPGH